MPPTWVFPTDKSLITEAVRKSGGKKTFIAKPAGGSEGCGIFLFKKTSELPMNAMQQNGEYVI
jgi:hypothetical protein